MATAYLAPAFNQSFPEAPLGRLHTYDAGTTTPKAAYQNQAGTVSHALPTAGVPLSGIQLDAYGRPPEGFFLGAGEYTMHLYTALGTLVKTWDDVGGSGVDLTARLASTDSASDGDAMLAVKQPFTGAADRTQHDKNIDVATTEDFALPGTLSNISAAVASMKLGECAPEMLFGKTACATSGQLTIGGSFNVGRGFTLDARHVPLVYSGTGVAIRSDSTGAPEFRIRGYYKNLCLTGPGKTGSTVGVQLYNGANHNIDGAYINGFAKGIQADGALTSAASNSVLRGCGYGYYGAPAYGFTTNHWRLRNLDFAGNDRAIYQDGFGEGLFLISECEIAGENAAGTAADGSAVVDLSEGGWATIEYTHTEANNGEHCIRYDAADADKGMLVLGSNLISSTNTNQIKMLSGNLTAISSRIVGGTAGVNLATGATAWVINCETNPGGDLANYSSLNKGRIAFGTQASATGPLLFGNSAAITKASNTASTWRNDTILEDFENSAGSLKHRRGFVTGVQSYVLNKDDIPYNIFINDVSAWSLTSNELVPQTDNLKSAGTGALRFSVIYAGTGAINTSDEREKQDIEDIPDAWLDAWADVRWQRYRFRDAVEKKGDGARWHVGVVAQRVRDAFAARGLDAFEVGVLCHDAWEATEEISDGGVVIPARPAGDRYGIRYEEAFALECALLRRRLGQLGVA